MLNSSQEDPGVTPLQQDVVSAAILSKMEANYEYYYWNGVFDYKQSYIVPEDKY